MVCPAENQLQNAAPPGHLLRLHRLTDVAGLDRLVALVRDKVLLVDQISPEVAFAKVQLEMFGGVMQDYLSLLHVDGSWFVISKLYKQVGKSE